MTSEEPAAPGAEPRALVVPGPHDDLSRPGLSVPAPGTPERLLAYCRQWAAEVGWALTEDAGRADAIILGPGAAPPAAAAAVPTVQAIAGRGVDGYQWALRHLAYSTLWRAQVVAYGPGADHIGDLRRPPWPGSHPVAVLLHGGFWTAPWQRDLMDGIAVDLARRGWASWNVEYRRIGAGGGWPQTGEDVLAAVDHVQRLGRVDPRRLLLVGHSAGAQLALWAAGERGGRGGGPATRVVGLAGICDLDAAARGRVGGSAVDRFLGRHRPSAASPIERLPLGVPVLLAHAVADRLVPVEQSRDYAAAATREGDAVDLVEVAGGDHMSLLDPRGDWSTVASQIPDGTG